MVGRVRVSNDGRGARGTDDGDGAGGGAFQSCGTVAERNGTRAGDGWGVWMVEASELFWVLLVGVGESDGVGECSLFGGLCGGAVEVFQGED